jgi:phosphatidylglycerol lysyltransferase
MNAEKQAELRLWNEYRRLDSGTLGHWTAWSGSEHWFTSDKTVGFCFRVVAGVAIVLTAPKGKFGPRLEHILEFDKYCRSREVVPAFYALGESDLDMFLGSGWRSIFIGQEMLLNPSDLNLVHPRWAKIRHSFNRVKRAQIEAIWTDWPQLSETQKREVESICDSAQIKRKMQRLGFTVGGLIELQDPEVKLMVGVSPSGAIVGLTSWLPIYEHGSVVGRTLEFMGRDSAAPNGITEFLIGSTALELALQGHAVMSLSGVPFSGFSEQLETKPFSVSGITLRVVARLVESKYDFHTLRAFKRKFHPVEKNLFLVYQEPRDFLRITFALARAYMPTVGPFRLILLLLRP